MSGFKLDTSFTDANMPQGESVFAAILGHADLDHWFRADDGEVTESGGKVTELLDQVSGSSAKMKQTTASKQGTLEDDIIAGFPALYMLRTSAGFYDAGGFTFDVTLPFSIVGAFKVTEADSAGNHIFCGKGGGTFWIGHTLNSGDTLQMNWGSASVGLTVTEGEWVWFIASYDGTDLHLSANGGSVATSTASGTPGVNQLALGQISAGGGSTFEGYITDLGLFGADIQTGSHATLNTLLAEYFGDVLGI